MIIIQLKGGLGNQMFQYALYRELKSRGKEVKIDDETGFVNDDLRVPVRGGGAYRRQNGPLEPNQKETYRKEDHQD